MKTPINSTESMVGISYFTMGIVCVIVGVMLALAQIFVYQNAEKFPGQITCIASAILIVFGIGTIYAETKK